MTDKQAFAYGTGPRTVSAPTGPELNTKGWLQEAALRCLLNNLDPEVAEIPLDLVVYGGRGKAARNWESFDAIVKSLTELESDETLLIQSGKPVGRFRTHEMAPRVLIANSNLVPDWATWQKFWDLESSLPEQKQNLQGLIVELPRPEAKPTRPIWLRSLSKNRSKTYQDLSA